ncbi:MAG: hypothetical protein ACTHJQ_22275 [Rhizobiaceae bacterium]
MTSRFRERLGNFEMPGRDAGRRIPDPSQPALPGDTGDPFEHRRRELLNALALAAAKVGGRCRFGTREPPRHSVTIGDTLLSVAVDRIPATGRIYIAIVARTAPSGIKLRWEDENGALLEQRFNDVFVEMAVSAELLRQATVNPNLKGPRQHALEEEEENKERPLRDDGAGRREQQRLAPMEKALADRLLADVTAADTASRIREYISAVEASLSAEIDPDQLQGWVERASGLADRIDPIRSGRAKTSIRVSHETTKQ